MLKKNLLVYLFFCISLSLTAQDTIKEKNTTTVWRINFLNPAGEFEMPTGNNSVLSAGLGIGFGGSYPYLNKGIAKNKYSINTGFIYMITPFLDIQQKWFYNFARRKQKNKIIKNNSADFFSLRFLTRGNAISTNIDRTSDFDFAICPTWGMQRNFGNNFYFMFDIGGPLYYFDTKGNGNIFPIMLQVNLGINLFNK